MQVEYHALDLEPLLWDMRRPHFESALGVVFTVRRDSMKLHSSEWGQGYYT